MTNTLAVTIPPPLSVNHMYINTRYGGRVRIKKAREWFEITEKIIKQAMKAQGWITTVGQKVIVEINTFFPDRRKRDTNNTAKALADALEHAEVFDNDRYALLRYIDYAVDKENPRVELVIRKFNEEKDGWQYENRETQS